MLCQRVYGEQNGSFARHVFERLALGARTYGDSHFLTKDNIEEAFPESFDSAAYALLDLQRVGPLLKEAERGELRQATLGVLTAAVNLDVTIRRLRAVREDLLN